MKNVGEAPPVTAEGSRPRSAGTPVAAESPPEDQPFFDEVLHVGLRHTRALLEKRRKQR